MCLEKRPADFSPTFLGLDKPALKTDRQIGSRADRKEKGKQSSNINDKSLNKTINRSKDQRGNK
jgi:hypothetical protein